jgi:beta-glucosidase
MHANKYWITDVLKGELGFEGFVISDWNAISMISGNYSDKVKSAINAGVDMGMVANKLPLMEDSYYRFMSTLDSLVDSNAVPMSRIDDAVRRILRSKIRSGIFAQPFSNHAYDAEYKGPAHRAVAREAVRKSLVVLKNDNAILPLAKAGKKIAVLGTHADNAGLQCGGWTLNWQGSPGPIIGSTTILQGIKAAITTSTVVTPALDSLPSDADAFVIVTGEQPYAEYLGDSMKVTLTTADQDLIASVKAKGKPVILILVSGRPLVIPPATLANLDGLVAAWLPGSEGAGVADVLFGDFSPTGKLPHTWARSTDQIPINIGDATYDPLYSYGFGLTW